MGVHAEYRTYFKALADTHVALGNGTVNDDHFVLSTWQQFADAHRSKLKTPFLLLEPCDVNNEGPDEGQIMQRWIGALGIYYKTTGRNQTVAEREALADLSMGIIDDIVAQMREDTQTAPPHPLLRQFNVRSCKFLFIEEADYAGYRVQFEFGFSKHYQVNSAKWA